MFKNGRCYSSNTIKTIKLFLKTDFIIHPEKSSLQHLQEITCLGFVFSSREMSVTLTSEKGKKILSLAKVLFKKTVLQ